MPINAGVFPKIGDAIAHLHLATLPHEVYMFLQTGGIRFMDDAIIAHMRKEEAELQRKLDAVRLLLTAYGVDASPAPMMTPTQNGRSEAVKGRAPRAAQDRTDKFGTYGLQIINASLLHLPPKGASPVMTRDLFAKLEADGIEVRGENKVNALSALLARSSKVKSYGRAGWTCAEEPQNQELPMVRKVQNEEEPRSVTAGGSSVTDEGVSAPEPVEVHSNSGAAA